MIALQPGKQVRVKVRSVKYAGKMFYHRPDFNTHEGMVIPNEPWVNDDSFCMTGGANGFRVIRLDRVVDAVYVDGSKVQTQTKTDDLELLVPGSKGSGYVVKRIKGKWSCSCKGFQFRKQCKHVTEAKEKHGSVS